MAHRIAFLGLGAMGSRMARRLLAAGHEVTVWNRSPAAAARLAAAGARLAATPRDAAGGAAFVLAMLRDDEASRAVWTAPGHGALHGMTQGALALECSTLTPAWIRTLSAEAQGRGVAFVDAPLAGSRPQAEAGALVFLAGGPAEAVARAEPVLRAMGSAVHHAGPAGAGAALKLAVNALFAVQVAALAELLGMLAREGLDLDRAAAILEATPVCSPAAKLAAASMLAGSFAPMFPVELVEKDMGYVLATAGPAPLAAAAREVMRQAVAQGFGAENLTGIVRLYR